MKKRNQHLLASFLLIGALTSTTSCSTGIPENTLVVGLECGYAPFNWTQTSSNSSTVAINGLSGQYADGYDVQIARYLATELNSDLIIKKIAWDSLIASLKMDQINLIIAGMSETPTRAEQIDFSSAYYTSEIVGLVRTSSTYADVNNIQELSGARVVSQLGTFQDDIISQITGVNHLTGTDSFNTAALMVYNSNADCLILEYPVASALCATYSTLKIITFTEGNFTGLNEDDLSVSIGIKKGNTELLNSVNTALSNLSLADRTEMMNAADLRSREV